MAVTPTTSLLAALSAIGTEGVRPRPAADGLRAPATVPPPRPVAAASSHQPAAPDPARPLPRGSLVNIVV
jgi:hypothetical protein